jgi:hypothetical protein
LQTQCICKGGYKCTLVRDYRLVVKFQLTQAQYEAQAATIRSQIAASAGVPVGSVLMESSTPAVNRRLLGLPGDSLDHYDEQGILHISVYVPVNYHESPTDLMVLA